MEFPLRNNSANCNSAEIFHCKTEFFRSIISPEELFFQNFKACSMTVITEFRKYWSLEGIPESKLKFTQAHEQ